MDYVVVKYLHFLGIFALSSTLIAQHLLIKPEISVKTLRKLASIDSIYGLSAVVTLLAGLALWLWVGKAAEFYTSNPIFHIKLTLFVLIGLISIYPTLFFIKTRRNTDRDSAELIKIPKGVVMTIRAEIAGLLVLPLLAVLMAQGIGFS
ncbi:DUF2214 family protein [Neptuniibacter caesariensis]|uniref:DUF2214 domain-containing protein n=1 Tax=Neptuniibacter caesariensis TaxID=207954 RepID=A0A7U8GTC2_NEPCE|nr:DUF2214 family protein [Neptuniibacter caesariensis]EAR61990.1 hypothetical protein MED92_03543 [Oceanospirillum sp. MED92] [Neptuniibacter caesariensis]